MNTNLPKLPTELLYLIGEKMNCYDCYTKFSRALNLTMNENKLDQLIMESTCTACKKAWMKKCDLFWEKEIDEIHKRKKTSIKPRFIKFK